MRKTVVILILVSLLLSLVGCTSMQNRPDGSTPPATSPTQPSNVDPALQELLTNPQYLYWGNRNLACKYATSEQLNQLDNLGNEYQEKGAMTGLDYRRRVLQIMGLLPEDQPRITLDQAKEILSKQPENQSYEELCMAFDEIAGAADALTGTTDKFAVYYIDEDLTECMVVSDSCVVRCFKSTDWKGGETIYPTQPSNVDPVLQELHTNTRYLTGGNLRFAREYATPEQLEQLDNMISEYAAKGASGSDYRRPVLQIMGLLPEDQPRITLDQAKEILSQLPAKTRYEDVCMALDEIAGAADYFFGSGISRAVYFLDEDFTKCLSVFTAGVYYQDLAADTYEQLYSKLQ